MKNSFKAFGRNNADLPDYLPSYSGEKCPIDPHNPQVVVKSSDSSENYQRWSIVYPIGEEGEAPGSHHAEGYITVSSLSAGRANFLGFEQGKTIVSLQELIARVGEKMLASGRSPTNSTTSAAEATVGESGAGAPRCWAAIGSVG